VHRYRSCLFNKRAVAAGSPIASPYLSANDAASPFNEIANIGHSANELSTSASMIRMKKVINFHILPEVSCNVHLVSEN